MIWITLALLGCHPDDPTDTAACPDPIGAWAGDASLGDYGTGPTTPYAVALDLAVGGGEGTFTDDTRADEVVLTWSADEACAVTAAGRYGWPCEGEHGPMTCYRDYELIAGFEDADHLAGDLWLRIGNTDSEDDSTTTLTGPLTLARTD